MQLVDESIGNAAKAKAACEEGRVGFHVFDRLGGGGKDFVDLMTTEGGGEMSSEISLVLGRVMFVRSRRFHCYG